MDIRHDKVRGLTLLTLWVATLALSACEGQLNVEGHPDKVPAPGEDSVDRPDDGYVPEDPSNPFEPGQPGNPFDPSNPSDPDDPADPSDPVDPHPGNTPDGEEPCRSHAQFFEREVFTEVIERQCQSCHGENGFGAVNSDFELANQRLYAEDYLSRNYDELSGFARERLEEFDDQPLLLLKATGQVIHGGGEVFAPDSWQADNLREFSTRLDSPDPCPGGVELDEEGFFEGVTFMNDLDWLSRMTLSLASRVPTASEIALVQAEGEEGVEQVLETLYNEQAFYDRLEEGLADIFLTDYFINGNPPDNVLNSNHYPDRRWWAEMGLSVEERNELALLGRHGLGREPLALFSHIVKNDLPISEFVTADYLMVNPYSAKSYGVEDQVTFEDPTNKLEFKPAQLSPVSGMQGEYPHAGALTSYMMTGRYPSTNTNLNRRRSSFFYLLFLGVDINNLTTEASDPTAVADIENPTRNAADCAVCHVPMDPVAQLYRTYNNYGHYLPIRDDRFDGMFPAGFNGEEIPEEDVWQGLRWLGQRVADDPRFFHTMVSHLYQVVLRRPVLNKPADPTAPNYEERLRAFRVQDAFLQRVATQMRNSNESARVAFRELVFSPYFRAEDIDPQTLTPERQVQLEEFGGPRLLHPEAMTRRITSVFGRQWMWGPFEAFAPHLYRYLYGGINYDNLTERLDTPSGVMGAVSMVMANELACQNVPHDFEEPAAQRLLFPHVERDDLPGNAQAEARIRENIQHLHLRILGEDLPANHAEIDRTYELFVDLMEDGQAGMAADDPDYPERLEDYCRGDSLERDPTYAVRAWAGVISYLVSSFEFLYL
ncbi:hypothetical protein FRC98_01565 [Lujinxingia vulgaris]|uniref:DUF1588 domain-containing protein n=1 Tax=Lujinxingia vulgaris TaxID=2600176 RepID=A0A5C6XHW5_9DELT|nr:hypothetical protein [Lujinxingia vulgaris]TXD39118.1 hypothetical protein FRC98_01565 [Lujinxingia vulgaris]